MSDFSLKRDWVFWSVLIAALSSITVSILGQPVGHDAWVHLNWLEQLPALVHDGVWYPRGMPNSFGGFGSPAFYFYPPLTYWIASSIDEVVHLQPSVLFRFVEILTTFVSCWTSYLYFKTLGSDIRRLIIASLVYGFSAYRFVDAVIRSALSEHIAFAFLPLAVIAADRITSRQKSGWTLLALATGMLLLTSLPMAIMAGVSIAVALLVKSHESRTWIVASSAALYGVAVAAIFLFPLLEFQNAIHTEHLTALPHSEKKGTVSLVTEFRKDAPEYEPKWTSPDMERVLDVTQQECNKEYVQLGVKYVDDTLTFRRDGNSIHVRSRLAEPANIRFRLFFWPQWRLSESGISYLLQPDNNGFAVAELPSGSHDMQFELQQSSSEKTGVAVSGVSTLGLVLICITGFVRKKRWSDTK